MKSAGFSLCPFTPSFNAYVLRRVMAMTRIIISAFAAALVTVGCGTAPKPGPATQPGRTLQAPLPPGVITALPDRTMFHQQNPAWANDKMGGSGDPLSSDGCLVTAVAMALSNLGFRTDPGDLNRRLTAQKGFTSRGWLIWAGLERVTDGRASTRFYTKADDTHIRACLNDGFYPLVKFKLPSRRPHWAMVVAETRYGFYIRDPMVMSRAPIPLSARTPAIDAVRCVGVGEV